MKDVLYLEQRSLLDSYFTFFCFFLLYVAGFFYCYKDVSAGFVIMMLSIFIMNSAIPKTLKGVRV